ncbi:MAG: tripartite tricarboxylate transporter substrate-binding protein [Pseudolabrys sp.]
MASLPAVLPTASAGSAADGYTVLVTTTALAINETLHKNKGFTADDFTSVAIAASSPESLSVPPTMQVNNIGEFLKAMQGKPINFGSAGAGSGSHIATEYFLKALAKVPATHVPFQGGAPARNAATSICSRRKFILGINIHMFLLGYGQIFAAREHGDEPRTVVRQNC